MKAALVWFEGQGMEESTGRANGRNGTQTAVQNMLYHIGNLKKRPGAED